MLWWLLIGFLAGTLAKVIMPGDENMGIIKTTLLGVAGSFAGGFLWGGGGFIGATIGAILILVIFKFLNKK